jgi:CRISPR-associated protein (TIGR03986 family)
MPNDNNTPTVKIKAPYNFVPLEEKAFYPSWANHISQDIPFEDGVSGSIEYTITAETPIFVRNGQKQEKDPKKRDNKFSQTSDGRYFIPGTSIKGEIRNVLEILSFGKMTQVQDARFGIRDLGKGPEGDRYKELLKDKVFCGWLKKTDDFNYIIEDCGKPGRIYPEEIDGHFHSGLKNFDLNLKLGTTNTGKSKEDEEKLRSALNKYELLGLIDIEDKRISINIDGLDGRFKFVEEDKFRRKFYEFDSCGRDGTLVITGQSQNRHQNSEGRWTGKFFEFIFFKPQRRLCVENDVIEDFLTIHKNNYDYKTLWKDRLNSGEKIPVFFMKDGNRVSAIGLAYMFRYPTANFIKGAIPAELQSSCHKDLAECMFGTESETLGTLKGRVYFSPAFVEGTPKCLDKVDTILSSPKPSFGPLYVKGGTWDDSNARIKGRKRYPVRTTVWNSVNDKDSVSDSLKCSLIPLEAGTVFTGVVRFHNLKIEEYGALLAALTFNGHDECFHSIGEAKPLGYGKVKIDIPKSEAFNIVSGSEVKKDDALDSFRSMMSSFYPMWENCNSLRELYAMAEGIHLDRESEFNYLKMSNNEFKSVKENGENLAPFTVIVGPDSAKQKQFLIERNPNRNIKLKNYLAAQIEDFDKKYASDIIEKHERELNVKTTICKIRDCLNSGELLKAKGFINELDSKITEKAILEQELSLQIQDLEQRLDNHYETFIASYQRMALNDAIVESDQIISGYAGLIALSPAELKYVVRKQELEKIKKKKIDDKTIDGMGLSEYYDNIPLNSIAAFASKLKRWMEAQKVKEISGDQAIELGQIVNGKMGGLNSRNIRAWKDRKQWKPISDLIGDEMASKAFDQLKNE